MSCPRLTNKERKQQQQKSTHSHTPDLAFTLPFAVLVVTALVLSITLVDCCVVRSGRANSHTLPNSQGPPLRTGASPNAFYTVSGRSSAFIACSRERGLMMSWLASALVELWPILEGRGGGQSRQSHPFPRRERIATQEDGRPVGIVVLIPSPPPPQPPPPSTSSSRLDLFYRLPGIEPMELLLAIPHRIAATPTKAWVWRDASGLFEPP